jgi:hypothetical protein
MRRVFLFFFDFAFEHAYAFCLQLLARTSSMIFVHVCIQYKLSRLSPAFFCAITSLRDCRRLNGAIEEVGGLA